MALKKITRIFNYIVEVSQLDLRHNEIHSMPESVYTLSNLKTDLRNNPLQCDCSVRLLQKYLQSQTEKGGNQLIVSNCTHSLWNRSVLIQYVSDEMFLCPQMCPVTLTMTCLHIECFSIDKLGIDAVMCSGYSSGLSSALSIVKSQIYINGAQIPVLEFNATQTTQLKYVNLTACNIYRISPTAFRYTPHLEVLVLAYNVIQTLSASSIHLLMRLKYLDLSHNMIQAFEPEMFVGMVYLTTIHLNANKITRFDFYALDDMHNLMHLSLYDNPWECRCNSSFKHWVVENHWLLNQPEEILCNRTGVPVILSNITCIQPMYFPSGHTRTHVVIPSILAVFLALLLTMCGSSTNIVSRSLYFPSCTCQDVLGTRTVKTNLVASMLSMMIKHVLHICG